MAFREQAAHFEKNGCRTAALARATSCFVLMMWLAWPLTLLLIPRVQAEIIDRLVAVVNRQVITLTDVEQEMKSQQLELDLALAGPGLDSSLKQRLTEEQATQRLIEQILIYQQIQEFPGTGVSDREIEAQLEEMQKKAGGIEAWNEQLMRFKTSPEEVRERIEWQLQVMKFIDYRFRQFVVVDPTEIESYYKDRFLPDLRKRAIQPEPELSEVEEKIRDILTEEKLNAQVDEWLASLKANASIQVFR